MSLGSLRRLRLGTAAAGFAALALALTGCGASTDTAAPGTTPGAAVTVATSTNVYGAIASAVGGDKVKVSSIINDPTADPHSHEATPAEAATVTNARIVVLNGGGYDDFMSRLTSSAGGDRTVIDVVQLSGLQPAAATATGHSPADGHDHGEFNEHVWYSLPTVKKLAGQLAADLGKADPAHAAEFTANAAAFTAKIDGLQQKVDAIKAAHSGTRVAVTEPVPGYLLEAAGLTDATPEEFAHAVETDTDPPAAVLEQTLALFTSNPVHALVLNAQTQTPTTDQVRQAATAANVPVVEVTETLPAGVNDYATWMGNQIDALAGALNHS
ncbi:metal ABC transporter solute-binding protein, Zn/Mn family [Pseudonocardia acidicola]|uniref:Zinc ABC transporter solute-binding protein n=1 Tax=Pseudonocardia acidicola TaxID=2724939 RepID=A0ABX1SCA6_9PSEU|nr:zinc ABC transporter substrate-binding protein [Pseudonocardia acidicola]NMH99203.1 zinc ABC transporter solute-binding protein [Pseudonocardia acidicola]